MKLDSIKQSPVVRIIMVVKDDLDRTDIVKYAYAMAYVTLFSLIPSLAATFALVSLFTPMFGKNSSLLKEIEEFILTHLATGSGQQAVDYLEKFLANTDFQKIGMTGFAGTIVALILLLKEIEMALNRIFEIDHARSLLVRFIYFWTFLTLGTFLLAVSIGTLSTNAIFARYVDISLWMQLLGDFFFFFGILGFFFLLYKVVPNRIIPTKHACLGAVVSTFFLTLAIKFFSIYIANFTSYTAFYGALSALPIFLFWLYVIWFITLFGALITKRSMEGWTQNESHTAHSLKHVEDRYYTCLTPFLSLLSIYRAYENKMGQGANQAQIALDLAIPLSDVSKAIHILQDKGLVVALDESGDVRDETIRYFPRVPAHLITYGELKNRLLGNETHWFDSLAKPGDKESLYQHHVQAFLNGTQAHLGGTA